MRSKIKVIDYFDGKADTYDLVDNQVYWRLSDALLWELLVKVTLPPLGKNLRILDAGGGTGRWTDRLLQAHPTYSAVIFDLSPAMTEKARTKSIAGGYADRLQIVHGDLADVGSLMVDERFDLVICFHNVLGFVENATSVLSQLVGLLTAGGFMASVVPNLYHGIYFNLKRGDVDAAEQIALTQRGVFTSEMPEIQFFTPTLIASLYDGACLDIVLVTGFPTCTYPGMEETLPTGSSDTARRLLGLEEGFERILKIESALIERPDVASRGNNIFALGRRR